MKRKIRNRRSFDEWYQEARAYYNIHGDFQMLDELKIQWGKRSNRYRDEDSQ